MKNNVANVLNVALSNCWIVRAMKLPNELILSRLMSSEPNRSSIRVISVCIAATNSSECWIA